MNVLVKKLHNTALIPSWYRWMIIMKVAGNASIEPEYKVKHWDLRWKTLIL